MSSTHGGTESGRLVYSPPKRAAHECQPPLRYRVWHGLTTGEPPAFSWSSVPPADRTAGLLDGEPDAPLGSVWRCGCSRYWTAADLTPPDGHGVVYVARRLGWRPATWLERRRARRAEAGQESTP